MRNHFIALFVLASCAAAQATSLSPTDKAALLKGTNDSCAGESARFASIAFSWPKAYDVSISVPIGLSSRGCETGDPLQLLLGLFGRQHKLLQFLVVNGRRLDEALQSRDEFRYLTRFRSRHHDYMIAHSRR